jgi:hypothetical protein
MAGRITGEMIVAAVCERYGWDYHIYSAQPSWFLTLIREKMRIDAERAGKEERRIRSKR